MSLPTPSSPFQILQESPKTLKIHLHEHFLSARELEEKLRQTIRGEVRFDDASRAVYSAVHLAEVLAGNC